MGYTHYWYKQRPFTAAEWEAITNDTRSILDYCKQHKVAVSFEYDIAQPPQVDSEAIRFNGVLDDGHETFEIGNSQDEPREPYPGGSKGFAFCKTAQKPYDLPVCMVLMSIARHAPGAMRISSDGDWNHEWKQARETYEALFAHSFMENILGE